MKKTIENISNNIGFFMFPLLLVIIMIGLSCKQKGEIVKEPENDFLKIPEYATETDVPKYTTSISSSDSTYWYVVLDAEDACWHGTVTLGTQYFDFYEARKQFDEAKGKGYFEFIIQISHESVTSYHKYSENK